MGEMSFENADGMELSVGERRLQLLERNVGWTMLQATSNLIIVMLNLPT